VKFLFLIFLSLNAFAFEAINLSVRFGTAIVDKDDVQTTGSGFLFQSELFVTNEYGVVAGFGSSSTESDDTVNTLGGSEKSELVIENQYLQLGGFYYLFPGFRVSSGLSYHMLEVEENAAGVASDKMDENVMGLFFSTGYAHNFGPILLGAEYTYTTFGDYNQSGLFLILGLLF